MNAVQRGLGLTMWQQAALVRIYALVRMERTELLNVRRRILSQLQVRLVRWHCVWQTAASLSFAYHL